MQKGRRPSNPEINKLLKRVERAPGWRLERTRSGWKMFSPNGSDVVTIHDGSSARQHIKAIQADLKRAGLSLT